MGNLPNLLFVIDTNKEANAIKEARRLGHPGDRDHRLEFGSRHRRLPDSGQ